MQLFLKNKKLLCANLVKKLLWIITIERQLFFFAKEAHMITDDRLHKEIERIK